MREQPTLPGLHTLYIEGGDPSFKRNVEVKLEGNNKTSKKSKIEKETRTLVSALKFDYLFLNDLIQIICC